MSFPRSGTRTLVSSFHSHPPSGGQNGINSRDLGLSKLATASMTFTAATARVAAANGTFSAFAVGDLTETTGTALNNGVRTVTGIDAVNGAFLVFDFPPKDEGPVTATVRSV